VPGSSSGSGSGFGSCIWFRGYVFLVKVARELKLEAIKIQEGGKKKM
jgi:hypothetical protein